MGWGRTQEELSCVEKNGKEQYEEIFVRVRLEREKEGGCIQDQSVWSLLENSRQFWLDVWRQKRGVIVLVANIRCALDAGGGGSTGWRSIPGWEARMQWSASVGVCVSLAVGEE